MYLFANIVKLLFFSLFFYLHRYKYPLELSNQL